MKVIRPVTITESELVSSSVVEDDHPAYSAGATYALGDRVIYEHARYECVQGPSTGNQPDESPLYWAPLGPTNRWLMFDEEVSTQTVDDLAIVVTIAPGMVDSLAMLNLIGAHINVTVRDGLSGPVIYNREYPLDGSEVYDWYQYFYQPFIEIHEVVISDLPLYGSAHITMTLTGGGQVRIGSMIAGMAFYLGEAQLGASAGIIDYSRKETSATGKTSFAKRKYSKRMSAPLLVENYTLNNLFRTLADLRATPCVWIGTEAAGYEPLTIFGFYKDFSIDIEYPTASYCNIEIEGLT